MKKLKKRIFFLILLLIFIIIEIVAFTNSKANKIITLQLEISDIEKLLENETIEINASMENNEDYYIILPDSINGKRVVEYEIEEIQRENNTSLEIDNNINNENIIVNEGINQLTNKKPGDKLFLSTNQQEEKYIKLLVKYDTKISKDMTLYNKKLEQETSGRNIKVEGYMPIDARIVVQEINEEEIISELNQFLINNVNLKVAYDIKILNGETEYEPSNYNETIKVTISNINDNEEKEYRIVHIDSDNSKEVTNVNKQEDCIIFDAEEFSIYAVLEETNSSELVVYSASTTSNTYSNKWNGEIAENYSFGNGSQSQPYLISTGDELAYMASQVNSGNTYENIYFQLASDIDLDNRNWTTIGNHNNSFRGIFDGAGHIISNAKINIPSMPSENVTSFGLFGTIGGGNYKSVIKNLEINNVQVSIGGSGNASGSSREETGIHVGTLVGTVYKNSQIINCIAKNCTIRDNGSVTIYNRNFQYAVGGLVGYAQNTANTTTDPGEGSRYLIENCFVNTNIELTNPSRTSYRLSTYDAQYHTGGIIGSIRSQPIWPANCLYVGTINSKGFIGPIFGALRNNTGITNRNNYATLWNGNDAGNLTMTSYYSSFAVNGSTFTANQISGTSTSRLSSSTRDIGYVQGVNKGRYTSSIESMLTSFNNYAGDEYIKWKYENGTYSFIQRFYTSLDDTNKPTYIVNVENEYNNGPYTYEWYLNGNLVESLNNQNQVIQEKTWDTDFNYTILVGDGQYYSILHFTIYKYTLYLEFNINEQNNTVTANLAGEALPYINLDNYTYQWYILDVAGLDQEVIEGENSLILEELKEGTEYKLIATNNSNYSLNVEGSFIYGDRNVIYVDYNNGNNNNDGYTPNTAVETMQVAYRKLESNVDRNANIIVIMGTYSSTSYFNYDDESRNASYYKKNATITGIYDGIDYDGNLYFYSGTSSYRYLNGDTTLQYLDLYGNNNQMYFYLQGYSLTMGEGLTMVNYANSNQNQGLLGANAPAVHIICGWCQYNYTTLPRNNSEVIIKSGTYGRIIGGGSPGTSDGQGQENSHDFTGSSIDDSFKIEITIDIKNSTTGNQYDYDVNLLTGGSACGNNYSTVTENIKNGSIGRVLGASIGDSQNIPVVGGSWWGGGEPWPYPNNTFLGETTINITGGEISELYGGCLGRNMGAIDNYGNIDNGYTGNTCDSYFYGTININIKDGIITNNIYGAGAGGVTGYSINSSDPYKEYGEEFETSVNINIQGGTINGNIYGGGYGYTEYLNANVTATDGGSLYGDSNIIISGSPIINGNIYAAGCGYNMSSRPNLAQMEGNSNIQISGSPVINGEIFGAGAGLSNYENMAKLIGNTSINIYTNLNTSIYGGGNNAKVEGTTNININNGNHLGDIYGGGNLGIINGSTNVNINGGEQNRVFGRRKPSRSNNFYCKDK